MEHGGADAVGRLVLELSLILFAAKVGGELIERLLRQPAVLGELAAGLVIGPYALGALPLPYVGAVFALPTAEPGQVLVPVSPELYALGQLASVILLFVAGLETDFRQFMRFGPAAGMVGAGGIILPFLFGVFVTVMFGLAASALDPPALFMGAIMTATSVGITARVLGDLGRLDSPEGVTILGAAVIDDVLGILVLAIVVSSAANGVVSPLQIAVTGTEALGFWLGLTIASALLAPRVARIYSVFRTEGSLIALTLAMAFLSAYLAQSFGLALIIGAYSAGLAFSRTPLRSTLEEPLRAVYHALVPIFFVLMGMLVDLWAMLPVLAFGSVITLLAIVGKVVGCALPALLVGFNGLGAARVGLGMLPRGEVALIIAGAGLTSGAIRSDLFGVAVMMTVITTVLAPILMVPLFRWPKSGWRQADIASPAVPTRDGERHVFSLPSELVTLWSRQLEAVLLRRGFKKVADVQRPVAGTVVEYRRDNHFLSFRAKPDSAGRREMELEADTPEWRAVLQAAVDETGQEVLKELAESVAHAPAQPFRSR